MNTTPRTIQEVFHDKSKPKRKPRKSTSPRQHAVAMRNMRKGRVKGIIGSYQQLMREVFNDGGIVKFKPLDVDKFVALMNLAIESAYQSQCKLHPKKGESKCNKDIQG